MRGMIGYFVSAMLGWFFGAGLMWAHFYFSGLIRSRAEYTIAKADGRKSME